MLACEVTDATGDLTALFYGRAHIAGMEPGRRIRLHGMVGVGDDGRPATARATSCGRPRRPITWRGISVGEDPLVGQGAENHPGLLPQLQLDELLSELQGRLQAVLATRDRMRGLLEAVVAIGSGLDLESTLRRIVETAVGLVDATYGALGVIGEG